MQRLLHGLGLRGLDVGLLLVLGALERAPAAPVSAVRESSVVIAAILAAVFLHEEVGRRKVAGAIAVAVGVGLIAYS